MVENSTLKLPEVQAELEKFVRARLYTDGGPFKDKNKTWLKERFKTAALPLYVFMTPEGREVARLPESDTDTLPTRDQFMRAFAKAIKETYRPASIDGPPGQ